MTQHQVFNGIQFIQMGGTIDKSYPSNQDNHGYNFVIGDPASNRILGRAAPEGSSWSGWIACLKDSLDLNDMDRSLVANYIRQNVARKFVITHGTDTIRQTGEVLAGYRLDKTIVLTGAMQPELFRESDADFNLGMAVAAVRILPPGVYIALHANVTTWEEFVSR